MHKHLVHFFFIIATGCIFLNVPLSCYADSPADLVKKGNTAYRTGNYDMALSSYEEASVAAPESAHIYFNKGAAYYRKGDYSKAAEAFEKGAVKSKDTRLEAASKFNLGNCAFREAERRKDNDLDKALDACQRSIRHYQDALELDTGFTEAAENIEVVRLVMKSILDEINRQKQAAKKQQQALEGAAEKLKELIERQKTALERNQQIREEMRGRGDAPQIREEIRDLARYQNDLKGETEELAKNLAESLMKNAPKEKNPGEKHLENAAKEQQAAAGNLEQYHTSEAEKNQDKALRELKNALEALRDTQKSGIEKPASGRQQTEQQKQQDASSADSSSGEKTHKKENLAEMEQLSDDAHDILDEERENRRQRSFQSTGGYRAVDKDW